MNAQKPASAFLAKDCWLERPDAAELSIFHQTIYF